MPRALLALCALIVAGGCPGLLAPQMDPVRWRCEAVGSSDPAVRDEALAFLEQEFLHGSSAKYKFATDAQRDEVRDCAVRLARLLNDSDPAVRSNARRTLRGMSRYPLFWSGPGAAEVVAAVQRDAERLWRGTDLPPEEARERARLLETDLRILSLYREAAAPALPLAETILAAPPLPFECAPEPGDRGALPPDRYRADHDPSATPTVQDAAAELLWSIGGRMGVHPAFRDS